MSSQITSAKISARCSKCNIHLIHKIELIEGKCKLCLESQAQLNFYNAFNKAKERERERVRLRFFFACYKKQHHAHEKITDVSLERSNKSKSLLPFSPLSDNHTKENQLSHDLLKSNSKQKREETQ